MTCDSHFIRVNQFSSVANIFEFLSLQELNSTRVFKIEWTAELESRWDSD